MRIITHTCPDCGTIVAGNVLYQQQTMQCVGLGCDEILSFEELPAVDRKHLQSNFENNSMVD